MRANIDASDHICRIFVLGSVSHKQCYIFFDTWSDPSFLTHRLGYVSLRFVGAEKGNDIENTVSAIDCVCFRRPLRSVQ